MKVEDYKFEFGMGGIGKKFLAFRLQHPKYKKKKLLNVFKKEEKNIFVKQYIILPNII